MKNELLNEKNFELYAAMNYNPSSITLDTEEFEEDLKRFSYLKRLFNRYKETGDLKERLILNHIIIIYNVFGIEPGTKMLFLKLEGYYDCLIPFLSLLDAIPPTKIIAGIRDKYNIINTKEIIPDPTVNKKLERI